MAIFINLDKAKVIAHDIRRQERVLEFKPLDDLISKQIPGTPIETVESQRQAIRDKYAQVQLDIDSSTTVDSLVQIIEEVTNK